MKKRPLVSVIVPTKNSAEFLEACLQSIKKQTFKAIELIVVDNHSTDQTPAIAKRYADKFFTQGPERSAQRNYGFKKSQGDYVAIIDSDMELTPRVIESCLITIGKGIDTRAVIIPEESLGNSFWAQCKRLERSFYIGIDWIEAARFFDKYLYTQLGGYNDKLASGEDWDLSRRAIAETKLGRTTELIMHNEGHISLIKTLKKKYYYAKFAADYLSANPERSMLGAQVGPLNRYKLFLSQPRKLFKNPTIGIGMLYMKTCEFAAGALGYLLVKIPNSKSTVS